MKCLLSISLLVSTLIILWLFIIRPAMEPTIETQWDSLLQSKTTASELRAIRQLCATPRVRNGYRKIIGITKEGSRVNMIEFDGKLADIQSIDIIFYWKDKRFHGKEWHPVNKENVYAFFRDE